MEKFTETVQHTFLEYLASGFELSFMVAIDFTGRLGSDPKNFLSQYVCNCKHFYCPFSASNGNPRLPDSLHYVDPSGRLNAYQRVRIQCFIPFC